MKRYCVIPVLLAFSLGVCPLQARADDGGEQGDNCQGGSIQGNETLDAHIMLVATNNAPSGASGLAELKAYNNNGTTTATLDIKTVGLDAGDYTLSAVLKSDGSTVTLGTITISASGNGMGSGSNTGKVHRKDHYGDNQGGGGNGYDNQGGGGSNNQGGGESDNQGGDGEDSQGGGGNSTGGNYGNGGNNGGNGGYTLASETQVTLPSGVDPMDIGQILLSDSNGNVVLIGDVLAPSSKTAVKFKAVVKVMPGVAAPKARGRAQVQSIVQKRKQIDRFTLATYGLPANSPFAVHVNGKQVATAKSNKRGNLMIKSLPLNLLKVASVRLIDQQGREAASAKF